MLEITSQDYLESNIIHKNVTKIERIILDNLPVDAIMYEDITTVQGIRPYLARGQHLDGKPITNEAFDVWLAVRKQYNQNLKSKRENNSRDKL